MPRDYRFINKDPWIDVVRTGLEKSGITLYELAKLSEKRHGPKLATIQNWFYGDTRFPTRFKMEIVLDILEIDMRAFWQTSEKQVVVSRSAVKFWSGQRAKRERKRRKREAA